MLELNGGRHGHVSERGDAQRRLRIVSLGGEEVGVIVDGTLGGAGRGGDGCGLVGVQRQMAWVRHGLLFRDCDEKVRSGGAKADKQCLSVRMLASRWYVSMAGGMSPDMNERSIQSSQGAGL